MNEDEDSLSVIDFVDYVYQGLKLFEEKHPNLFKSISIDGDNTSNEIIVTTADGKVDFIIRSSQIGCEDSDSD